MQSRRHRPRSHVSLYLAAPCSAAYSRLKPCKVAPPVTTKITFTEPDEKQAIARFHALKLKLAGIPPVEFKEISPSKKEIADDIRTKFARSGSLHPIVEHMINEMQYQRVQVEEAQLWAWMREKILNEPALCAKMTGIEQLGWLDRLEEPVDYELEKIGEFYFEHAEISKKEMANSRAFWKHFRERAGCQMLSDITREKVLAYEKLVKGGTWGDAYVRAVFAKIKTILRFYQKKHGVNFSKALALVGVMDAPKRVPYNPKPISRDDYEKLLDTANGNAAMTAILLTALNCAFYPVDCANLKWDDLDLEKGYLSSSRSKTGVARIACLWTETVNALKTLPCNGDYVFRAPSGRPHSSDTIRWSFKQLKTRAKLPHIEFNQIRDGAYSVACNAPGVTQQAAEWLAGHTSGVKDAYVKRAPETTRLAAEAIHRAYLS